ncbi:hypothetical protein HDE_11475 [Halotydeus destructor]|nr:hypothetical protein HDE_11475 [Halotydeus destructor]
MAYVTVSSKTKLITVEVKHWVSQWYDKLWHFSVTVVDQEMFNPGDWSNRLVWTSCCVAIFVAVFGYVLNFIQTDGVVEMPPKRVEQLYDLFQEREFKAIHLMMFSALHFYSYLLTAPKGTLAFKLYSRMVKTDDCKLSAAVKHCSFLELDLTDPTSLGALLMFMASDDKTPSKGRRGMLVDKSLYEMAMLPAGCIFTPDVIFRTRSSKDFVVADYATMFYSKTINRHLMKYVNYRTMALVEANTIGMFFSSMVAKLDSTMPSEDPFTRFRCMYHIGNEKAYEAPPALDMGKLRKTLIACIFLLVVSLIAVVHEILRQH